MAVTAPVIVSIPSNSNSTSSSSDPNGGSTAHHKKGGGFVNPWESFVDQGMSPMTLWRMWQDWKSSPIPPPELLPQIVAVNWGQPSNSPSLQEKEQWSKDLKATWLGHACFLVEWPTPAGAPAGTRGARILFDPVWSNRCSPSQYVGPARVTPPPFKLSDLPHVDAVVISHNHYDHLDVTTLRHISSTQPRGSVHFFAPLGNKSWFESVIGCKAGEVTELDWWEERDLKVNLGEGGAETELRVTCTPCQHFTGRSVHDRNDTLWASWAISAPSTSGPKIWFGGDTGYKSVPRGATTEVGLPTCPAFAEIGRKFGSFDLAMIPIGAYDPRWFMSRIHCSPEDAVELHQHVKSRKSIGMHYATWILTPEEMTEPPKRLRAACEANGITPEQFNVCDIGETVRVTPAPSA